VPRFLAACFPGNHQVVQALVTFYRWRALFNIGAPAAEAGFCLEVCATPDLGEAMSYSGEVPSQVAIPSPAMAARPTTFLFEYVGRSRLEITGCGTGITYHFDRPGARVLVDGRDGASLSVVTVLRRVAR